MLHASSLGSLTFSPHLESMEVVSKLMTLHCIRVREGSHFICRISSNFKARVLSSKNRYNSKSVFLFCISRKCFQATSSFFGSD